MKDCSQFLIDRGYEPSHVGGLYFSSIFEEIVYMLSMKEADADVKKELPEIMREYASEFYEVEPSHFMKELVHYQKEHQKEKTKESLEDELLRLGKEYCFLHQQKEKTYSKYPVM